MIRNTEPELFVMKNTGVVCHVCAARQLYEYVRPLGRKVPITVEVLCRETGIDPNKMQNSWTSLLAIIKRYSPEIIKTIPYRVANDETQITTGFTIIKKWEIGKLIKTRQILTKAKACFLMEQGGIVNGRRCKHATTLRLHNGRWVFFDDDYHKTITDEKAYWWMMTKGFCFLV